MSRAATTTDAFNAVAEPRRRQILDLLAGGERPVGDLVRVLELAQPQVSKHLRVLREVGAVDVEMLEQLLLRVGRLAEEVPEVAEMDCNPVIASPDGASVVDVKVHLVPEPPAPLPGVRRMR